MSDRKKNYPESTPAATTDSLNNRVAAFPSNDDGNRNSNDRNTGINPFLLVPSMHEMDNTSPSHGGIWHQQNDVAQMDYRIAQAWIASAPSTEIENPNPSIHSSGIGEEESRNNPEEFQDEFTESVEGSTRNKSDSIRNPFEGIRKTLFSYSQGVPDDPEAEQEERVALRLGLRGSRAEDTSLPSTPPSIPEDLMNLSSNKNNSGDIEGDNLLPLGHSYGPTPMTPNANEESSDDENDISNVDGTGCTSFKAVVSPGEVQEASFLWMRNPKSLPDEIVVDNDQKGSVEDEALTGDGEKNRDPDSNELFRPPVLGTPSRPMPIQGGDRQQTPNSWHTPISMRPRGIYRNTSGGSRRTRGSIPRSPGSRRSIKSEKYYHSYETDLSSPPRPVPPFVVVHNAGSAVVKVTPKRTTLLADGKKITHLNPSSANSIILEEKNNESKCGCGNIKTETKSWCRNWGRPVMIAITTAIFVLALVTVVTSLVANRNAKKQQLRDANRQNPPLISTEFPTVSPPTGSPASKPVLDPDFGNANIDLILDVEDSSLDPLWEGIIKRPYEETQNPALVRPTIPPRTFPPNSSPSLQENFVPTFAPTMLPENFPDYVPTNLPFLIPRTEEPTNSMESDSDDDLALQIPWNNYVIGLLSVESPNTFNHLDDPVSPQFLALQWISVDSARKGGSKAYTMDASLQRYALGVVYFALGGEITWANNDAWLSSVVNVCDWHGIICDDGDIAVLSIDLAENNLSGTLPEELNLLKYLQIINFSDNAIGGTLPPEYADLDELVELNLAGNELTGSLPEEYGGDETFELLEVFDVSQNKLEGNIPSDLGSLGELKSLKLDSNGFSGDVPSSICDSGISDIVVDCSVECECCSQFCKDGILDDDS